MPELVLEPWVAIAIRVAITIIWTASAALGAYLALGNISDARRDLANLIRRAPQKDGIVRLEAEGCVMDQRAIFWALFTDFLAGALASIGLLLIPPENSPAPVTASITGTAIGLVLTSGNVALVWLSYARGNRRRRILRMFLLPQPTTLVNPTTTR